MSKKLNNIFQLLEKLDNSFRDLRIINEELLFEAASLNDVHKKYYSQIPEEEFRQIVAADPTSGNDKMGKYSKWLLALYANGELKLEDLYKATEYLTTFHKYKGKLERKDIGQYKSLPDLYDAIEPYADNTQAASHKEEIRQIKQDAEKVYEDGTWLVVVPHTKEAAIEYGKGTQWCTAATGSSNYFDYYNEQGPLYININKKTGQKYQFHFETDSFMDERDMPVSHSKIGTKGLKQFYYQKYGIKALYDFVQQINKEGDPPIYMVNKGSKYNIVDENNELKYEKWFKFIDNFYNGFDITTVYEKDKRNFMNRKGELLFDEWFIWNERLCGDGPFIIQGSPVLRKTENGDYLERKSNFVTKEGKLLSPDLWFDDVIEFQNGYGRVEINSKWNAINKNGELISNEWFDRIGAFDTWFNGAIVKKDGLYNYITPNGTYRSEEWFKRIGTEFYILQMSKMVGVTQTNNKENLLMEDGELFFDEGYDSIFQFTNSFLIIKDNGKKNIYDPYYKEYVLPMNVDEIYPEQQYALLVLNNKYNIFSAYHAEDKIISDVWFDHLNLIFEGTSHSESYLAQKFKALAYVWLNGKTNILCRGGHLLFKEYVDKIVSTRFTENTMLVERDGKYNKVDLNNGEFMSEKWLDNFESLLRY